MRANVFEGKEYDDWVEQQIAELKYNEEQLEEVQEEYGEWAKTIESEYEITD